MKNPRNRVRSVILAFTVSLLFVAVTMAQQEISPDRFESVALQSKNLQKGTTNSEKKHIAKVRHARSSAAASVKSSSAYTQIARK